MFWNGLSLFLSIALLGMLFLLIWLPLTTEGFWLTTLNKSGPAEGIECLWVIIVALFFVTTLISVPIIQDDLDFCDESWLTIIVYGIFNGCHSGIGGIKGMNKTDCISGIWKFASKLEPNKRETFFAYRNTDDNGQMTFDRKDDVSKEDEDMDNSYQSGTLQPIALKDDRLNRHAELIKERNELLGHQLVALAKEMFAISLYTGQKAVILDNCKLSVQLRLGQMLQVSLYLKKVRKRDKRMTWRNLLDNYHIKARKLDPSKSIASFDVSESWNIESKNFGVEFIKLLPAARLLAAEKLDTLMTEAEGDIEFMKSTVEVDNA